MTIRKILDFSNKNVFFIGQKIRHFVRPKTIKLLLTLHLTTECSGDNPIKYIVS